MENEEFRMGRNQKITGYFSVTTERMYLQPIHFFEFSNLKSILSLNSIFSWILPPTSSPLLEWAFALGTKPIYLLSQQ